MPSLLSKIPRLPVALLALGLRLAAAGVDDPGLRVTEERTGSGARLLMETVNCTDLTVTLTAELQNLQSTPPLPLTFETHGPGRFEAVAFKASDPSAGWRYSYRYSWRYGTRGGKPDGTVYALPYDHGTPRRLMQGYRGHYSHQAGSPNEYALDWAMPEGTTVRAARGGTVVGVRQDSTVGGASRDFLNCANYVIIRHSDGTYGEYLHLQAGGAQVHIGDQVETGAVLALSGNTGFSSSPHLHFAVFRALDGRTRETLPVQFRVGNGPPQTLVQGRVY